jgi:hypothetical protein
MVNLPLNKLYLNDYYPEYEEDMDKQIRKIEKENKKEGKDLKHLEKMDKKRDKFVDAGKKAMKKHKC